MTSPWLQYKEKTNNISWPTKQICHTDQLFFLGSTSRPFYASRRRDSSACGIHALCRFVSMVQCWDREAPTQSHIYVWSGDWPVCAAGVNWWFESCPSCSWPAHCCLGHVTRNLVGWPSLQKLWNVHGWHEWNPHIPNVNYILLARDGAHVGIGLRWGSRATRWGSRATRRRSRCSGI